MNEKVADFLTRHKIDPSCIDIDSLCRHIRTEMRTPGSSMPMIESYCKPLLEIPFDKKVIVIDAGGTNFRTCLMSFDKTGKAVIEDFKKCPMPGSEEEVTAYEFFSKIADETERLIEKSDRIGFCFSYPATITPDHDGCAVFFTKEIKAPQVIGKQIGKELLKELSKRGHDVSNKKIIIMNDTVTTLLAGVPELAKNNCSNCVGFILGTGTNVATQINGSIINEESGNLDVCIGDIDELFFKKTITPDKYHFEKMISGAYLGPLAQEIIKAAINEGLFSEQFSSEFSRIEKLETVNIGNFLENKPSDLDICIIEEADNENLADILSTFIERTAKLVAANLAASVLESDWDGEKSILINADGTTYYKTAGLKENTEKFLYSYLKAKGRSAVITQIENSPAIGAAIGALSL